MGVGAVRLCDLHPRETLALVCEPCGRRARHGVATLMGTYGPQAELPDIRSVLAAGCECRAATNSLGPRKVKFEGLGSRRLSSAASPY